MTKREEYWLLVASWHEDNRLERLANIALQLAITINEEDYRRLLDDYHYFEGWGGEVARERFNLFGVAP